MKAKLLIMIGCVGILINYSATNYAQYIQERPAYIPACSSCAPPEDTCDTCGDVESNCGGSSCSHIDFFPSVNCQCADPGCSVCNDCLSPGECCEAFGNVGSAEFQPLGCDP